MRRYDTRPRDVFHLSFYSKLDPGIDSLPSLEFCEYASIYRARRHRFTLTFEYQFSLGYYLLTSQ